MQALQAAKAEWGGLGTDPVCTRLGLLYFTTVDESHKDTYTNISPAHTMTHLYSCNVSKLALFLIPLMIGFAYSDEKVARDLGIRLCVYGYYLFRHC